MDTFGARLKRAREVSGLTQPDIADELARRGYEVAQSTVSHYEISRTQPRIEVIAALASILGVSVDYLVGLTDEMSPVGELLEELDNTRGGGRLERIMGDLSRDAQRQVIEYAEFLRQSPDHRVARAAGNDPANLSQWIAATEVLRRRLGELGDDSFLATLAETEPEIYRLLIGRGGAENKSVQGG